MQLLQGFTTENPTGAQPTPPSTPAQGVDPAASAPQIDQPTQQRASETLFRTTMRRIAGIEIDGIIERRQKPEKITQWFEQIGQKITMELRDAAEATGRDIGEFAESWVTRSKDLLLECHRSGNKYETVADAWFDRHFDEVSDG